MLLFVLALLFGSLSPPPALAEDLNQPKWLPATIGPHPVRIPLVDGLLLHTAKPDKTFAMASGGKLELNETIQDLSSMAEADLGIRSISLRLPQTCRPHPKLPICQFAWSSKDSAYASWIQIIHRPDMASAQEVLGLKRSREFAPLERRSGQLPIALLQRVDGRPYFCPPDHEFGHCQMHMQVGTDLLAVMMFWREKETASLTPYEQLAQAMFRTVGEMLSEP